MIASDSLEPEEWKRHAVLHLDLNGKRYDSEESLFSQLNRHLDDWEAEYGCGVNSRFVEDRFDGVIKSAYRKTGLQVVVLIDEYDKPIIDVIN